MFVCVNLVLLCVVIMFCVYHIPSFGSRAWGEDSENGAARHLPSNVMIRRLFRSARGARMREKAFKSLHYYVLSLRARFAVDETH